MVRRRHQFERSVLLRAIYTPHHAALLRVSAEYGRRANGEWVAAARYPDEHLADIRPGSELVSWRYEGPFDRLAPGSKVDHRVIPWDEVALDGVTMILHKNNPLQSLTSQQITDIYTEDVFGVHLD